jgi:hypothetical protein
MRTRNEIRGLEKLTDLGAQVPDLFAQDETSKIIEAVRSKAKAAGKVIV